MKNLFTAFLCMLGVLCTLTQGQANNFSGSTDTAYISSFARDNFLAPPANDDFANATNVTECCPIAPETIDGKDNPAGREINRRVEYNVIRH